MNKILIYAAVAVLVLVLILGYWQFFVGYACGLATFWFLGEHTLRMAAGNLCSKGKEIGNELKEKVTPSAQREDMVITDSSVMSAATPGMYQVIVKIGQRCFLLPPSCDNVVPTELQKGQNIVLESFSGYSWDADYVCDYCRRKGLSGKRFLSGINLEQSVGIPTLFAFFIADNALLRINLFQ